MLGRLNWLECRLWLAVAGITRFHFLLVLSYYHVLFLVRTFSGMPSSYCQNPCIVIFPLTAYYSAYSSLLAWPQQCPCLTPPCTPSSPSSASASASTTCSSSCSASTTSSMLPRTNYVLPVFLISLQGEG